VRTSPEAAWRAFREQVEQDGGQVLEEIWLGATTPHRIICGQGHRVSIRPSQAHQSGRICAKCSHDARTESSEAWRKFRERVEACGGQVIEPAWLGRAQRHRVRCQVGHETAPIPSVVARTGGICRICSGNDPETSEALFRKCLAEQGAELLEPYVNSSTAVLIRCAHGHETKRLPDSIRGGHDCIVCAGKDQGAAWREFCRLITESGGRVLEPKPLGNGKQHRIVCPKGHETKVIPSLVRLGKGLCGECSPVSAARSEREFRRLVGEAGGRIIEPSWLGALKPHRVVCRYGHESTPRPNDVLQGHGICRKCANKTWDVFYVVVNEASQVVKFGITSNDARVRLSRHRTDGFGTVVTTIEGMSAAPDLERAVKSTLQLARMAPVRGREYYSVEALPLILDVVDQWAPAAL